MGLFSSFKKSSKLAKLSKILGKEFSSEDIMGRLRNFNNGGDEKDIALEQLLDICESDNNLKNIMISNNVTRTDLKELYQKLYLNGSGLWTRGHFICASALVFGATLDFCLRENKKNTNTREIINILYDYFDQGKLGSVD